ncbi:MAG TPA: 4-hydroxyphenylacetate 3-hydroxylase N-terminal domain-containing protein [Xanthobacteraceae bacterium]|nr:4-hydroxyphenylacetate 3-hydroxylase N-terminal domain-containing protein [Xanthobacteraceae bacterium]
MLATGKQKLERMRDGRAVYIGAERVSDVTSHPAFRQGAQTVARLYDMKADPAKRELFTFEEDSERISLYWLRCKTRDDLLRRMRCCKAIADATYGFIGRSPDQVSGLVTGLAMNWSILEKLHQGFGQNLLRYYDHARKNDLYLSFAVTPASGRKSPELFPNQQRDDPNLRVIAEDDAGVTVAGMKMMATSAVFADEILIGNLTPIDDTFKSEAITAALPLNASGVSLWSRQPYALAARHEADYPLSYRYDETDSVLVCDNVKIPWERVFLHNEANMSRRIYIETPANCYQNHQSNIRFWSKMGLIVGVASRICQANGTDKIPAVRETLGRLAALEATIGGLVQGQIEAWEEWPKGYATPNRRIMYAALNWCQEHHTEIIDTLRTLLGAYPMVMPSSIDVMSDDGLRDRFERWWKTASIEAVDRFKLYKLAWDLVGSEFAGRHMLYEKFYAGNSLIVRNQSDREAPWEQFHATVDRLLNDIEVPDGSGAGARRS